MPREDAFSDVPYAARKYLAEVERKRQSMNRRSPGSGDEYVKGQIRAAKGSPKRITKKSSATPTRSYQGPPPPSRGGTRTRSYQGPPPPSNRGTRTRNYQGPPPPKKTK